MELRKIIRTDLAASAIAHLTLVALIILISDVHPYQAQQTGPVNVTVMSPEQFQEQTKQQETKEPAKDKPPEPKPELTLPKLDATDQSKAVAAAKPAAKQQAEAPSPQQKASPEPQQKQPQPAPSQAPKQREANFQPQQVPEQTQPQPMQQSPMPQSSAPQSPMPQSPQANLRPEAPPPYAQPQPDINLKYGINFGLPPDVPRAEAKDDGGDGRDSVGAKLSSDIVAAFRRHVRSCAKLPAGSAPASTWIKLQIVMTPDGTLARTPLVVGGSPQGPLLAPHALRALEACQPYTMLPPDKYEEWKLLDLTFKPSDFGAP